MSKTTKNDDTSQAENGRILAIITRACEGDASVRPELKKLLDEMPDLVRCIGGDLAKLAETSLIGAIAGKNIAQSESLSRKMESLRNELAGAHPTPIERLLVERVAICWLHVYHADCKYATPGNVPLNLGDYYQRQQDRAHRRYLQAIKMLATVRRLAQPIKVDVNVAATVETKPTPSAAPSSRFSNLVSTN